MQSPDCFSNLENVNDDIQVGTAVKMGTMVVKAWSVMTQTMDGQLLKIMNAGHRIINHEVSPAQAFPLYHLPPVVRIMVYCQFYRSDSLPVNHHIHK